MSIDGEVGTAVPVEAQVGSRVLILNVGGVDVGSWALTDLDARPDGGGVTLRLGSDRVVIDVSDRQRFLAALAQRVTPTRSRQRPSAALVGTAVGLFALIVLGAIYPATVGSAVILAGLCLLLLGTLAQVRVRVALRLPLGLQAGHFMGFGTGVTLLGLALILLA